MNGQLAESGAHVVMAVRNVKAAQELIQKWQEEWTGRGLPLNIEVMELDLLSLDSVVRFADAWNARLGPLYVLINNAGIFSIGEPQKISKDGDEEHMQVNHLAPALLSVFLLPSLIRGSPSRTVNVNSVMHYVGFVDPEDMNVVSGKRKFTSLLGYTSSKLAQPLDCFADSDCLLNLASMYYVFLLELSTRMLQGIFPKLCKLLIILYHISSLVRKKQLHELDEHILLPFSCALSILDLVDRWETLTYKICKKTSQLNCGSRSTLFSATDPQIPEYCDLLRADDWPVCAFMSQDCRPTNPSKKAHNVETSYEVWEKTLEMIGLPSDAVEKLIEGEEVKCKYGTQQEAALSH
ncbi:hypothetical protein Patl1_07634 [Pistacia atlantica]|uniref:Uncharacterized protein n=1 Tax=Pistacia atlantica TaxID=434234 RepID=A0ACC1AH44_9ROSI|nr:hypothetical protein Patl1_07634 [Pistacia atlantica]